MRLTRLCGLQLAVLAEENTGDASTRRHTHDALWCKFSWRRDVRRLNV